MLTLIAESALRSLVLGSVVWTGLHLLRVRNPHVHMTAWVMVLMASLSMPLLMHFTTVTVTLQPLPVPAPENLWPTGIQLPEPLRSSLPPEFGNASAAISASDKAVNWWTVATAIYALV